MAPDIAGRAKAFEAAAAELRVMLTAAEGAVSALVADAAEQQARLETLEAMRDAAATAAKDERRRTEMESQRAERAEIAAARLRQERNEARAFADQLQADIMGLKWEVEAAATEAARQARRAEQAEAAIQSERESRVAAEQLASESDGRATMALTRAEQVENAMQVAFSGSRLARVWQALRGSGDLTRGASLPSAD